MGNILNTVKRFSNSDVTDILAQNCSCLSVGIGTSRLDKCTFIDNGISVTGEAQSASKGGCINGCRAFCEEVTNEGMDMTPSSTSTKGCIGDTDLFSLPLVHTKPSGSDEANKERETPNGAVHTDARELGCVDHSEKTGLIYNETAGHMLHSLEDDSTGAPKSIIMLDISKDSLSKVSPEGNSSRNPNLADDVENSPATDAHSGKELMLPRGSPADGLFDCNVCKDLADGALDSGYKSSAEVSLEGQRHEKRTDKSLNYDVVPIEATTPCANSGIIGLKSNAKSSSKGRAKRKRNTKSSRKMLVPKEGVGTLVPLDMICLENEEQPTGPLAQSLGDKVLQGTPRSRKIKTPLSYVQQSPLTHSKGKELSVSTPESVKMKRSRSGRLIVPRLDPGTQNIIYDPDGSICAITNLEVQFPQGISSEPPSKRRRSRRLSPVHNRLLTF